MCGGYIAPIIEPLIFKANILELSEYEASEYGVSDPTPLGTVLEWVLHLDLVR